MTEYARDFRSHSIVMDRAFFGGRMRPYMVVVFMGLLVYSIVGRLAAFGELKKLLRLESFLLVGTFFYVEVIYFRHRKEIGTRAMDVLVASLVPAFLIAVSLAYLESRLW